MGISILVKILTENKCAAHLSGSAKTVIGKQEGKKAAAATLGFI